VGQPLRCQKQDHHDGRDIGQVQGAAEQDDGRLRRL
jgi:hypothetical protein